MKQQHRNSIFFVIGIIAVIVFAVGMVTADADSLGGPSSEAAKKPSLDDIYYRIRYGTNSSIDTFEEPNYAPGSQSLDRLTEIYYYAPEADNNNGATASDVKDGKTFWGLTSGEWGNQEGELHGGCVCEGTLHGTRWCDNGDGTITDMLGYSGEGECLVWLKNANCTEAVHDIPGNPMDWEHAMYWAGSMDSGFCGLNRPESDFDWTLPTESQFRILTHGVGAISTSSPGPFVGIQTGNYWTSTIFKMEEAFVGLCYDLETAQRVTCGLPNPYIAWPVYTNP